MGKGIFDGKKAIVVGNCQTWFHEAEDYIEIYPEKWNWVGSNEDQQRLAWFGPAAFGVQRDPKTEALLFSSQPKQVMLDGSRMVTVVFANGKSEKTEIKRINH